MLYSTPLSPSVFPSTHPHTKTIDIFCGYDNLSVEIYAFHSISLNPKRGGLVAGIQVSKDPAGRVIISFPYDPLLVEKVKTIAGRRWHPAEKHWSFPSTDGMLEKILKIFGDENVQIDPSLQAESPTPRGAVPDFVVSAQSNDLQMDKPPNPPLEKGGERGFEDLRRELVSRKYSYKTVKGYIYYNRDFLNFTAKAPSEVNDNDIKDYLLYLAEEKESATATINQAINALKFYYGAMLKKKFVYEVRRPRKDKKLPVVLSQEEVARILSSVRNIKHQVILMLVYSAGLRVGEVVRLKIEDIDSQRMLIHIRGAKGRKDRYTMLSETALNILKEYLEQYRPGNWLFEGARLGRYLSTRSAEKIFEHACQKAQIGKDVSVHTLRGIVLPLIC